MLFDKYQYIDENVSKRGYSQTCVVRNVQGNSFFAKWILGLQKGSVESMILRDNLRHLQKAAHPLLPKIIDHGYDEDSNAYAIVYQYIEATALDDGIRGLKYDEVVMGLSEVADCLSYLQANGNITHGNLTPANIVLDNRHNFYLIDFGLSDIIGSLTQDQKLLDYAAFVAPEKFTDKKYFPYQSDIYSFGKILEWTIEKYKDSLPKENLKWYYDSSFYNKILAKEPAERPLWKDVVEFMKQIRTSSETKYIYTDYTQLGNSDDILERLNSSIPEFDVSPTEGQELLVRIHSEKYSFKALWKNNDCLVIIGIEDKNDSYVPSRIDRLDFKVIFTTDHPTSAEISKYFYRWYQRKKRETKLLKRNREAIKDRLGFYKELVDKEIEVIQSHSLKLQYSSIEVVGNEVHFILKENEKCTSRAGILKHIDDGNDVNADSVRYIVSANGNVGKESVLFVGTPMKLKQIGGKDKDEKQNCFIIKDVEHFDKDKMPISGFIKEDDEIKIEEKRRQKDAIDKVLRNDVQNVDLIYYLFSPDKLQGDRIDYRKYNINVQQKGIKEYSYNQTKAIVNALQRTPLSVIQGPPGTGKTTVITEIVFQLLAQKPDSKILITSQTNNAVDQVLENLLKNDISILRLSGLSEPRIEAIKKHTLNKKLSGWKDLTRKKAIANFKANESQYESRADFEQLKILHEDWLSTLAGLKDESAINQRLVDSIRVIGATCNHIASKKYSKFNFEFDYVIMDESGKATVAESLVPIIMGNNLIFVGDHRQLRPMLTADKEVEKWLRKKFNINPEDYDGFDEYYNRPSLFEDVITVIDENFKTQLTECRRSSEEQVRLTSKCFYEPEGDVPIEYVGRPQVNEHNLPLTIEGSVFMIDIGSEYENEVGDGKSSFNRVSEKVVGELLNYLDKYDKIKEYSVGVITGYSAQYRKLFSQTKKMALKNIPKWKVPRDEDKFTVSVIDRFQGLERDIVVVDLVKSGVNLKLGFLETPNRINVALSRQKRLLIIVGDYNGIINAKPMRCQEEKCALQNYLKMIREECVIKSEDLKTLFK